MNIFITLTVLAVLSIIVVVVGVKSKRRRLGSQFSRFEKMLQSASDIDDQARRLMEYDAVFEKALGVLGYEGSFADKLKLAGPRFHNLDAIWTAHKLRNRIAHEPGTTVSEIDATNAYHTFHKALKQIR